MRFLADENVSRSVVNWMRTGGHDVAWAYELARGEPDFHWLELANAEQRIVVTSDKDFWRSGLPRSARLARSLAVAIRQLADFEVVGSAPESLERD